MKSSACPAAGFAPWPSGESGAETGPVDAMGEDVEVGEQAEAARARAKSQRPRMDRLVPGASGPGKRAPSSICAASRPSVSLEVGRRGSGFVPRTPAGRRRPSLGSVQSQGSAEVFRDPRRAGDRLAQSLRKAPACEGWRQLSSLASARSRAAALTLGPRPSRSLPPRESPSRIPLRAKFLSKSSHGARPSKTL